ncbi:MAG TPA: hypothetical protein DEB06_03300, partial [Phycisphaerales bacterium]|nr:hypothetical protein [Phycisphaerales bacterium]
PAPPPTSPNDVVPRSEPRFFLAILDRPVERLISTVAAEPLEDEARKLMADLKHAAEALQNQFPRLSFANSARPARDSGL